MKKYLFICLLFIFAACNDTTDELESTIVTDTNEKGTISPKNNKSLELWSLKSTPKVKIDKYMWPVVYETSYDNVDELYRELKRDSEYREAEDGRISDEYGLYPYYRVTWNRRFKGTGVNKNDVNLDPEMLTCLSKYEVQSEMLAVLPTKKVQPFEWYLYGGSYNLYANIAEYDTFYWSYEEGRRHYYKIGASALDGGSSSGVIVFSFVDEIVWETFYYYEEAINHGRVIEHLKDKIKTDVPIPEDIEFVYKVTLKLYLKAPYSDVIVMTKTFNAEKELVEPEYENPPRLFSPSNW